MHITHRAKTLDEIVGLSYVVKSLRAFKYDAPLMFTGERGTGKTSLANIMARNFGATELNIRSINCRYYSKIDNMREEIDNLYRTSIFGAKKVLILDEIHNLSDASQEAWLIPLENLPVMAFIIACTTTTQKIKPTLLRRFRQYTLKNLDNKESVCLINKALAQEGLSIPKWVTAALVEKMGGNPGLILNGLSKVINVDDKDEIDYLLESEIIKEDEDALALFKLLLSGNSSWHSHKSVIKDTITKKGAETVRVGLMNLIGSRMLSDYSNAHESHKLSKLFDCLREANTFPEKANLVNALFKGWYSLLEKKK